MSIFNSIVNKHNYIYSVLYNFHLKYEQYYPFPITYTQSIFNAIVALEISVFLKCIQIIISIFCVIRIPDKDVYMYVIIVIYLICSLISYIYLINQKRYVEIVSKIEKNKTLGISYIKIIMYIILLLIILYLLTGIVS